jgi:TonB family protein
MRGLLLLALTVLAPTIARAIPAPETDKEILARTTIVSFAAPPTGVACAEGVTARVIQAATPPPVLSRWTSRALRSPDTKLVPSVRTYRFSVDADGRVVDFERPNSTVSWSADDQVAVIASWRFAPNAPARDCALELTGTYQPITEASPAKLVELLADQGRNPVPQLRQALEFVGDCQRGARRRPQMIVYPDTRPFDDKTVDPAWAGLSYDIDRDGVVRNVRVLAQHGGDAFGDVAASAVADARYFPGAPRTGCVVAFKATPKASPPPRRDRPRPSDAPTCTITQAQLNLPEKKAFPPAFAKRRVGGRALLRFDVTPQGQVDAIGVLEAQPSATFGEAAHSLLTTARPAATPAGHRGCFVPIVYAIPALPDEDD